MVTWQGWVFVDGKPPRACQVAGPTLPSTYNRWEAWKAFTKQGLKIELGVKIGEIKSGKKGVTVAYANANKDATALVDPEIVADPGVYPPEDVRAKLVDPTSLPEDVQRQRVRAWTATASPRRT